MTYQRLTGLFLALALLASCGGQQAAAPTASPPTATSSQAATSAPQAATPQASAAPDATSATATRPVSDTITFEQPPEWARGAVMYQLFVRVFTPEGTLAAATARLPEIRDLGIDIVYLLPIQPIGQERRKGALGSPYSIRDYRAIDPALGTTQEYHAFVDKAHALGMRVIMDLVANHTAWDNPLTTQHPDWYTHNAIGAISSPQPEWTDVADLNYDNPDLRQYMIDTSLYWVEEFGIDGFRCDVSEAVPSDFWLAWRSALKAQRADLLLLSESEGVQMYKAGFEVAYDWATSPAFIKALLAPNLGRQAISQIAFEQKQYGPDMWRMRYLENHDHDRIAAALLDPRQRQVGAAFLLTIPGIPLIYAGQEIGAKERPSLFDPFTVDFANGDAALRAAYKTLIRVRHESPALRANRFARVQGMPRSVLMYERSAADQRVIVLINLDDAPAEATPEGVGKGRDLVSGEAVDLSAGVALDAFGYRIVALE